MLIYILQTIAFQLIFLIVYELFLKKETFFSYNRVYLLVTPVLAMLLPLLRIPMLQDAIPAEGFQMLPEVFIGRNTEVAATGNSGYLASETSPGINWWLLTYGAGLLFSLGIFFYKFRLLKQLFAHQPVLHTSEMKIVEVPQSKVACTFYNTIFLGTGLSQHERDQILSHELVHVKQKHTLDLLFFEVFRIIYWFNPLIYIYQSRISACHEFLADAGVVEKVKKQDYFQQLLNSAFNTEDISFINQFFNHSIIKKRIVMLQRSRSKSVSKFKFLIILPLMMAMLTYVSCSQESEDQLSDSQKHLKVLTIEVEDFTNQTSEEKEMIRDAVSQLSEGSTYKEIIITDGVKTISFTNNAETGNPHISVKNSSGEKTASNKGNDGKSQLDIPFAVIDEVPVFPGCEDLPTNAGRKECFTVKVTDVISENFDTSLGKKLGLTGVNRVYVQFKISKDGSVEIIGVRAKHPDLEQEARRVVNLLPNMTPGKQKGENVDVLYTLPITFKVGE